MKTKKADVRDSQWYQIGVRYAEGASKIHDFPPTPNFYLGVVSVIVGNPKHWLWNLAAHPFWQKLGGQIASGAVKLEALGGYELPANQGMWEEILSGDPDTRLLGMNEVVVPCSGSFREGTKPVIAHPQKPIPAKFASAVA